MTLIDSTKNKLKKDDQAVIPLLDFNKTDEEIITLMITAGLIKFDQKENENNET